MTEHQHYIVRQRIDGVELREYPEHTLAQVTVGGRRAAAASTGFGPLLEYINGRNAARRRIAMTAPVLQRSTSPESHTVSFVLPADLGSAGAPQPADPRVRITTIPTTMVAARRFRGIARESRFRAEEARLLAAVRAAGLAPIGEIAIARFDPPWTPGALRHNEVMVAVTGSAHENSSTRDGS